MNLSSCLFTSDCILMIEADIKDGIVKIAGCYTDPLIYTNELRIEIETVNNGIIDSRVIPIKSFKLYKIT